MNKFISVAGGIVIGILAAATIINIFGFNPFTMFIGLIALIVGALFGTLYVGKTVQQYDAIRESAERQRITSEEFAALKAPTGITLEEFRHTLQTANDKVRRIIWAADKIKTTHVDFDTSILYGIASKGFEIIREIKDDPRDWRIVRSWFNTYLDQTVNMVEQNAKSAPNVSSITDIFRETLQDIDKNLSKVLTGIHLDDTETMRIDMEILRDQMTVENR